MVKVLCPPRPDFAELAALRETLRAAILDNAADTPVEIDIAEGPRPAHLVIQLLASAVLTQAPTGRRIAFGPRAAAEVACMDLPEGTTP